MQRNGNFDLDLETTGQTKGVTRETNECNNTIWTGQETKKKESELRYLNPEWVNEQTMLFVNPVDTEEKKAKVLLACDRYSM